jgi:hypothetical protein
MKIEDGKYVAFIGWDDWPVLEQNKARALKNSKIHVGVYRNGRVHSTCARVHGRYHNDFDNRHSEIFLGKVNAGRICKFCLDDHRPFWQKLQQIEAPPKEYYFIVDLVHDDHRVIQTDDQLNVVARLKNYVAYADHLENINAIDGKLFVVKGSLVELDVKVRTVVEHIKFKTKEE